MGAVVSAQFAPLPDNGAWQQQLREEGRLLGHSSAQWNQRMCASLALDQSHSRAPGRALQLKHEAV